MQEFYMLPFILAYLYSINTVKINVQDEIAKLPVPSFHTKFSSLITLVLVGYFVVKTNAQAVNHLFIVLSLLCGAHLMRGILEQTNIEPKDAIYPTFASAFLLTIYNIESLQRYIGPVYLAHAVLLLSFIKGKVLTPDSAFDTFLLSHFAFYITK